MRHPTYKASIDRTGLFVIDGGKGIRKAIRILNGFVHNIATISRSRQKQPIANVDERDPQAPSRKAACRLDTEDPAAYCQTQEILRLAVPAENLMPRESQEVMVDGRTPMPNQASFVPSFSMVTTVVPLVTGTKGL